MTKRLEELMKAHADKIAEINAALKTEHPETERRMEELKAIETDYKKVLEKEIMMGLEDAKALLEKYSFQTIYHKTEREDGIITGVSFEEKTVQLNAKTFCELKNLPLDWYYDLQALNKRLTLKVALALGLDTKEIRKINDSYNMHKLAEEVDLGKTPESDTQCVKHMQSVFNKFCPDSGKVNKYDLGYIMACYSKKNKKRALSVICSKHDDLMLLMEDVMHRVITGKVYGLDYKASDDAQTEVKSGEAKKVVKSAAKAKKVEPKAEEKEVAVAAK